MHYSEHSAHRCTGGIRALSAVSSFSCIFSCVSAFCLSSHVLSTCHLRFPFSPLSNRFSPLAGFAFRPHRSHSLTLSVRQVCSPTALRPHSASLSSLRHTCPATQWSVASTVCGSLIITPFCRAKHPFCLPPNHWVLANGTLYLTKLKIIWKSHVHNYNLVDYWRNSK